VTVEDLPSAFEHGMQSENCIVVVFDRPWNDRTELPNENFVRCRSWMEIDKMLDTNKEIN